jgi:O-antigen/teichoic acid export membrane protein
MRRLLTLHRLFDLRLGGSAVFDQAVVGGMGFVITIVVGRVGGTTELGLFALVTTIWYLVLAFLDSAITVPFTVFVHRLEEDKRVVFAGSAMAHVIGLGVTGATVVGSFAAVLYWLQFTELAVVLAALAVTIPFRLLRLFARSFHYATLNLNGALTLDIAVAVLELAALAVLFQFNGLTAAGAFLGVGGAHLIAFSVWLMWNYSSFRIEGAQVRLDLFKNWGLGRWLVAGQLATIVAGYSLPWIIAWMQNESKTGIYFGCATLVRIGAPFLVAVQNVLVPRSATAFAESGLDGLRRVVRRVTVGLVMGTGMFTIFLAVFGHYLVELFFGPDYAGQGAVVALLAMNELAFASMLGAASGLTVLERSELLFRSNLAAILVTVTLAWILISQLGLPGAAMAQFSGTFVGSLIAILYYRRVVSTLQQAALADGPAALVR